uniref:Uncharacterized protein n=1 Tax=Sphaerodactylus townsendi TaxID=933632 RepID=A0ACB8EMT4_9SAUR
MRPGQVEGATTRQGEGLAARWGEERACSLCRAWGAAGYSQGGSEWTQLGKGRILKGGSAYKEGGFDVLELPLQRDVGRWSDTDPGKERRVNGWVGLGVRAEDSQAQESNSGPSEVTGQSGPHLGALVRLSVRQLQQTQLLQSQGWALKRKAYETVDVFDKSRTRG